MTDAEYQEWAAHFVTRFPSTGKWFLELKQETRRAWFEDAFAELELRDCLSVNVLLSRDGEIAAYDRERIPALFIRRAQEVRHERQIRERRISPSADERFVRDSKDARGAMSAVRGDRIMGRAYRQVMAAIAGRKDAGEPIDDAAIRDEVDRAFESHDPETDNALEGPRYKCPRCLDSGLVSYRYSRQRPMVGHCSCELGLSKRDNLRYGSGRQLGPVQQVGAVEWEWDDNKTFS